MKPSRPPESLSQSDWQQTPPTVQAYLLNLHQRLVQLQQQIERLQNRLQRTAKTSDKPPSSDSPFQRHAGNPSKPTGKRGARQGHPGTGPKLHRPSERQAIYPEPCMCGQGVPRLTTPYHTHQVMELPSTLMHVTHWVLHQGKCAGLWQVAQSPAAQGSTERLWPTFDGLARVNSAPCTAPPLGHRAARCGHCSLGPQGACGLRR